MTKHMPAKVEESLCYATPQKRESHLISLGTEY